MARKTPSELSKQIFEGVTGELYQIIDDYKKKKESALRKFGDGASQQVSAGVKRKMTQYEQQNPGNNNSPEMDEPEY